MHTLNSNYKILSDYNLVIEVHSGILTAENYIAFKQELIKDVSFKSNMNHVIHFKNVKFMVTPSDIKKFVYYIENNVQNFGKRKVALITNTPNQVVSTTIYKLIPENKSQTVEIFSLTNNALKWLKLTQETFFEINQIIDSLLKINLK